MKYRKKKLLNRSRAKCYLNRWKADKILNNNENQLDDTICVRVYCKLIIFTEKKMKSRVKLKFKTLDKKYKNLINKSRPQLNFLSEEDIKPHKENTVKNLSRVEIQEWFIDVLSKSIYYKTATENTRAFDILAAVKDATKTLPVTNTSNAFRLLQHFKEKQK